ncbi:type II toxin-antitoxin system HicA family toxin [Pannonibacter carbonis]|uniref:type II toxin-antitoxin system HicA family toxin n=1 Tax=Pannonibacter carbonis TaxID=2067569 RepID=UPI000D0E6F83|nr:type II toxin-antitoxin system HicA family toxin [Pannonibacter carbonis]
MVEGFYRHVCTLLSSLGFNYERNAKGSHEVWRSAKTGKAVLVPRNLKSRHTANAILKDAGSAHRV